MELHPSGGGSTPTAACHDGCTTNLDGAGDMATDTGTRGGTEAGGEHVGTGGRWSLKSEAGDTVYTGDCGCGSGCGCTRGGAGGAEGECDSTASTAGVGDVARRGADPGPAAGRYVSRPRPAAAPSDLAVRTCAKRARTDAWRQLPQPLAAAEECSGDFSPPQEAQGAAAAATAAAAPELCGSNFSSSTLSGIGAPVAPPVGPATPIAPPAGSRRRGPAPRRRRCRPGWPQLQLPGLAPPASTLCGLDGVGGQGGHDECLPTDTDTDELAPLQQHQQLLLPAARGIGGPPSAATAAAAAQRLEESAATAAAAAALEAGREPPCAQPLALRVVDVPSLEQLPSALRVILLSAALGRPVPLVIIQPTAAAGAGGGAAPACLPPPPPVGSQRRLYQLSDGTLQCGGCQEEGN